MRVVVRRVGPGNRLLATGDWVPVSSPGSPLRLHLPTDVHAKGIVGIVSLTAEVVDATGINGTSEPVLWSIVPRGHGVTRVTHVITDQPLVAITVDWQRLQQHSRTSESCR